jgi:hypothetical protein
LLRRTLEGHDWLCSPAGSLRRDDLAHPVGEGRGPARDGDRDATGALRHRYWPWTARSARHGCAAYAVDHRALTTCPRHGLGQQADELPCEHHCAQEPSKRARAPDQLVECPDDKRALADIPKGCTTSRSQQPSPPDDDRSQPHRQSRVWPLGEHELSVLVAHPPPEGEDAGQAPR